jgi:hypothetical protein
MPEENSFQQPAISNQPAGNHAKAGKGGAKKD